MQPNDFRSRIWTDLTCLGMPLLVIVAHMLGWPSDVTALLTLLWLAGIFVTWRHMTDIARRCAERITRMRARLRRPAHRRRMKA